MILRTFSLSVWQSGWKMCTVRIYGANGGIPTAQSSQSAAGNGRLDARRVVGACSTTSSAVGCTSLLLVVPATSALRRNSGLSSGRSGQPTAESLPVPWTSTLQQKPSVCPFFNPRPSSRPSAPHPRARNSARMPAGRRSGRAAAKKAAAALGKFAPCVRSPSPSLSNSTQTASPRPSRIDSLPGNPFYAPL